MTVLLRIWIINFIGELYQMINFEKLKPTVASVILICLTDFFLVIMSFFLLARQTFYSLNLWQVTGLGLGIFCPILVLNGLSVFVFTEKKNRNPDSREMQRWASGGIISFFFLNLALLISY